MGQVIVLTQPRTVALERYEDRPLESGEVRLRTLYSGISAGTELATYRGSNPYMTKRWDSERRLFMAADAPGQAYPVSTWGYEEVGEVVERGRDVTAVEVGDLIYGAWGHRTHHIADEEYARGRLLPAGLEPILGIFSHIGAVALNGVHDAAVRIGETVAVFGLGVPGQIVAQLARRSGVSVIGVDLVETRLALALETGAIDTAINAAEGRAGERIKELTGGRGADVSFEVSGSAAALHEAIRATTYSGTVVALGFYQAEASGLFLGEEFHHNRVTVVGSQISGVNPQLTYRWNRLRLVQTVMRLQTEGLLTLRPLITHVYPFEQAAEAFRLLDQQPGEGLQVVLDCTQV